MDHYSYVAYLIRFVDYMVGTLLLTICLNVLYHFLLGLVREQFTSAGPENGPLSAAAATLCAFSFVERKGDF